MSATTAPRLTFADLAPEEVNLIFAGLGKLPLEVSVELWLKLKQQGDAQMAAHLQAASEPAPAKRRARKADAPATLADAKA